MAKRKSYRPLIVLAALAVVALALATLTFTNVTYWVINATLPPAMKYPGTDATSSATSQYVKVSYYYDGRGYNVTRISIVGFTGDPTNYTDVLRLCNRYYSGTLYLRLVAVGSIGGEASQYVRDFRVYFANTTADPNYVQFQGASVVQSATGWAAIGPGQCATAGAYVLIDPTLPTEYRDGKTIIAQYEIHVTFSTEPTGFQPGGGQPIRRTYTLHYTCSGGTYTATLPATYATYSDSLAYSSKPDYIDEYAEYAFPILTVPPVQYTGTSIRTQIDARNRTLWGLSAAIYDVTARLGWVTAAGATVQVSGTYWRNFGDQRNNVAYLSVGVDEDGDDTADVEYIAYVWEIDSSRNGIIVSIFVSRGSVVAVIDYNGDPISTPPPQYKLLKVSSVSNGTSFTLSFTLPSGQVGRIVGVAFVVVDPPAAGITSPFGDFWVDWQNFAVTAVVAESVPACDSGLGVLELGGYRTDVFVRTDSWRLVTQVDARGSSGMPSADYGVAAAFVDYVFNATGAQISVDARYIRGGSDRRNNVVYLAVAVDEDYDGSPDREYIYYRYDTADGYGVIVSPFTGAVVCTVDSAGVCAPTDQRYVVTRLGGITPGEYDFSITLNARGAATSVALAVTDATGNDPATLDDFAVEWGSVTITHYA